MDGETIHALTTVPGRSGIAVIRVSGPGAPKVLEGLTGRPLPAYRQAVLRRLRDDDDGDLLDEALVLLFEEGRSFTGEYIVEFQIHGSQAVVQAVLRAIDRTGKSRRALAGEFTRQAFRNRRMDLTQVRALGSLLEAETEQQRRQSMRRMEGAFGQIVRTWRQDLIEALAYLEASIDFVEEDVPADVMPEVDRRLRRVIAGIEVEIRGAEAARRIRSGLLVAIIGAPNVGKSSLLNALSKSDAAIVSSEPGTTRDPVEVRMDLGGLLVRVVDTAGLRETGDDVEAIGIGKARRIAAEADFTVLVGDDRSLREEISVQELSVDFVVRTKRDLEDGLGVSSLTGDGVDELLNCLHLALSARVSAASSVGGEAEVAILERAVGQLRDVVGSGEFEDEIKAELIRRSAGDMAEVLGEVGVEDILDHVFGSFCIGK